MSDFWARVKQSHLVQALVVYLAGAWVALQALDLFASTFGWPEWVVRSAIVVLGAGLVATLVLVWARTPRRPVAEMEAADRGRWLRAGAIVLALLLVGGALWLVLRQRVFTPSPASAEAAPGIAILPFTVNDPSLERWREGMVDLLATNLDGAAGLRAIDSRTVLSHWERAGGEDDAVDLDTALDVARSSGGSFAVVGSVVTSGMGLRIGTEAYDLASGRSLGQDLVEGSPDSIFPLVDQLSIRLLDRLLGEEGRLPDVDLAAVTTLSVPALKSFLDGEALFRRSSFEPAIDAYEAAVMADSTFALAWFRLGEARGWLETMQDETSESALLMANRWSDRLPERERQLLTVSLAYHRGLPDATTLAQAAVERFPDDPNAWYLLGEAYFHLPNQALPTRAQREEPFVRATRLDPSFTPAYIHLLDLAFMHGDSAGAAGLIDLYGRRAAASRYQSWYHTTFDLMFGAAAERRSTLTGLDSVPTPGLVRIAPRLFHPRSLDTQVAVINLVAARPDLPANADAELRLTNLVLRGKLEEAVRIVESPGFPEEARADFMTFAYVLEAPIDSVHFARALELGPADTVPGPKSLGGALYALDHGGRQATVATLERRARAAAAEARAAGDTLAAIETEADLDAFEGRRAMVQGRSEEALELFESAFRRHGSQFTHSWIMQLHGAAGRYDEAIRYGEIIPPNPWLGLPMGSLYEAVGKPDEALRAYGWVVEGWDEADAVLQPRVDEARRAIERLAGLDRG